MLAALPRSNNQEIGAGDENRTRVIGLEDQGFTIKLHPRVGVPNRNILYTIFAKDVKQREEWGVFRGGMGRV